MGGTEAVSLDGLLVVFSSSFVTLFPIIGPLKGNFIIGNFFASLSPGRQGATVQGLVLGFVVVNINALIVNRLFLLVFNLTVPIVRLNNKVLVYGATVRLLNSSGSPSRRRSDQGVSDLG